MDEIVQRFLDEVEPLGSQPDGDRLAACVRTLALDEDYWRYQIRQADGRTRSVRRADQGVQIVLARRTDGRMSYVHSHSVWVALSAVAGVETHRRYDIEQGEGDAMTAVVAEERRLRGGHGDVVTLVPPLDVHSHGHVRGSGDWPFTLIVLGDNQYHYQREEYDLRTGRRHVLAPGDPGITDLPDPAE